MDLEFKPVVAEDIDRLRPFYGLRPNKTCDSVFLDCFLWKDYYHVKCAVSEDRAVLWLMERADFYRHAHVQGGGPALFLSPAGGVFCHSDPQALLYCPG